MSSPVALQQLGANFRKLCTTRGGYVYFSYETAVAVVVNGQGFRLENAPTKTTAKHLTQYCPSFKAVSHSELFSLLEQVL